MNAKDLLIEKLKEIGADGLFCGDGGDNCGCGIDDFEPCGNILIHLCVPAKLNKDGMYYRMEQEEKA